MVWSRTNSRSRRRSGIDWTVYALAWTMSRATLFPSHGLLWTTTRSSRKAVFLQVCLLSTFAWVGGSVEERLLVWLRHRTEGRQPGWSGWVDNLYFGGCTFFTFRWRFIWPWFWKGMISFSVRDSGRNLRDMKTSSEREGNESTRIMES